MVRQYYAVNEEFWNNIEKAAAEAIENMFRSRWSWEWHSHYVERLKDTISSLKDRVNEGLEDFSAYRIFIRLIRDVDMHLLELYPFEVYKGAELDQKGITPVDWDQYVTLFNTKEFRQSLSIKYINSQMLKYKDLDTQRACYRCKYAGIILASTKHMFNLDNIVEMAKSSKWREVRSRAIFMLGELGTYKTMGDLQDMLKTEPHPEYRALIYKAIGMAGDEKAVYFLLQEWNHVNNQLEQEAIKEALVALGYDLNRMFQRKYSRPD